MSPFFSIITASFNSENSIGRTIESIKSQKFTSFEHIIIDGSSTDDTVRIINSHIGTYPLRYLSEPDSGIAEAMNKGIKIAIGKYFIVLHADDRLYASDSLQTVFTYLHTRI